jgi:hypothetical protein
MYSVMQDPGVARRLAQQDTDERLQEAARHRLAMAKPTEEKPSPSTSVGFRFRFRLGRTVHILRPSLR